MDPEGDLLYKVSRVGNKCDSQYLRRKTRLRVCGLKGGEVCPFGCHGEKARESAK